MPSTKPRQLAKLRDIRWRETSGVDHGANGEEGWIVLKSEGTEDSGNEIQMLEVLFGELLDGAPDSVRKAAGDVLDYVSEQSSPFADADSVETGEPSAPNKLLRTLLSWTLFKTLFPPKSDEDKFWEEGQTFLKSVKEASSLDEVMKALTAWNERTKDLTFEEDE